MYSALNLRPYLNSQLSLATPSGISIDPSFWFLAVGYFNVILPNLLPSTRTQSDDNASEHDAASANANAIMAEDARAAEAEDMLTKIFWHRAREAKKQSTAAAKHPLLISRTREMARDRAQRAKVWAREDDELERQLEKRSVEVAAKHIGIVTALPTPPPEEQMKKLGEDMSEPAAAATTAVACGVDVSALPTPAPTPAPSSTSTDTVTSIATATATATTPASPPPNARPKTLSTALLGLSLLGNLDGIYKHPAYARAGLAMHALTTGSRQRQGGMLLFAYTFAGRLWISLGYDVHGFAEGAGGVARFWEEVVECVGEFLV